MAEDNTPDSTPTEPVAPEVAFATKDEYTAEVRKHVNGALGPKLRKIEELEARVAEHDALKARLEELEKPDKKGEDKFSEERASLEKRMAAYEKQAQEAQSMAAERQASWHAAESHRYLMDLASRAGAAHAALADITRLFPRDKLRIEESDGKLQISVIDPETDLKVDALEAMQAWLGEKPHLRAPPPNGAGAPGAGAPRGQPDPLAGLPPGGRRWEALLSQHMRGSGR